MRRLLLGVLPLLFFIYLLVSADWDAVHEAAGRERILEDSVADPDSCTDSLWILSADRSSERLAAAGSVSDRDGSDRTVWDTAVQIRGVSGIDQ